VNAAQRDHADAERYRWLRATGDIGCRINGVRWETNDQLDAAIDSMLCPPHLGGITPELIHEMDVRTPDGLPPIARWAWRADYLNRAMAQLGKIQAKPDAGVTAEDVVSIAAPTAPNGDDHGAG
jgi:hypothetical protein